MRKSSLSSIILVALLVAQILVVPAHAQEDQEMSWGVEVGDDVKYVLQRKILDPTFGDQVGSMMPFITEVDEGQTVISRVDYLPPIPENGNESTFLFANCTIIRANDSEVLMEDMGMTVIPIGRWNESFNFGSPFGGGPPSEVNETTDPGGGFDMNFEQVNTTEEWGMKMSAQFWIAIFPISFLMEMIYYKANGTLRKMLFTVTMSGNPMFDVLFVQWYPGIVPIVPPPLSLIPYLMAAAIGIPIVLIVVFLIRRRRRRRSVPVE
ncbi:MAG: hypothetical protein RTU92_08420 [Candidatus Thorarchaeota archaeon]